MSSLKEINLEKFVNNVMLKSIRQLEVGKIYKIISLNTIFYVVSKNEIGEHLVAITILYEKEINVYKFYINEYSSTRLYYEELA